VNLPLLSGEVGGDTCVAHGEGVVIAMNASASPVRRHKCRLPTSPGLRMASSRRRGRGKSVLGSRDRFVLKSRIEGISDAIDINIWRAGTAGVDANNAGGGLWLSGDDLKRSALGVQAAGILQGDVCVPVRRAQE